MTRCYIVAEAGINVNGDVEVAKRLADVAKACGCDAVKLQKRCVEECYSPEELAAPCESPWGRTVGDKVRGRELSWGAVAEFAAHCDAIGIEWSASCFDLRSFAELEERFPRRPFNKVPSCMARDVQFMRKVAFAGRYAVVSTGLLDYAEIDEAARVFEDADCHYALAHCVALYPAPIERLELSAIKRMRERYLVPVQHGGEFPRCRAIGYSGHEVGLSTTLCAAVLGATYLERHVTLDRSMYGADQAASVEPQGLERLVRDVRKWELARGAGDKRLRGDEKVPVRRAK